jgi:hypothetical protein
MVEVGIMMLRPCLASIHIWIGISTCRSSQHGGHLVTAGNQVLCCLNCNESPNSCSSFHLDCHLVSTLPHPTSNPSFPLLLAPGSLLVTAGGNSLSVWDMVGGGRLLKRLTNWQKTVTCVKFCHDAGPESSAAPRLVAGSLDGHVKVRGRV